MIKNLVISGGGISGIGILGILKYLSNQKHLDNIQNYLGTSVGSILCFLLIIDYTIEELYYFLMHFDFGKLVSDLSLNTFLDHWGFTDIRKLRFFMKKMMKYKNINSNITFQELYDKTQKKLIVTGSCVNKSKTYYFNHITQPDMKVIDAIMISSCIPLAFAPIKYKDRIWLDGGLLANYPIAYFDKDIENTLGICIYDECYENQNKIDDLESFLLNVFKCIAFGQSHSASHEYKNNTINFVHHFYQNYGFSMSKSKKFELFKMGYRCAQRQKDIIEKVKNTELNSNLL